MAMPALFLPEPRRAGALPLPASVDSGVYARIEAQARSIVSDFRRASPVEGSDEERALIVRSLAAAVEAVALLGGGALVQLSRESLARTRRDLLEREDAAVDVSSKYMLRQIQEAAMASGVLLERVAFLLEALPPAALVAVLEQSKAELQNEGFQLVPQQRAISRFQLDLAAALAALDDGPEELADWAARAELGARRSLALLGALAPLGDRAERARLGAHYAWLGWTPDDVEQELEPWPAGPLQ